MSVISIIIILILISIIIALYLFIKSDYRGDHYYTKITKKGKKYSETFSDGNTITSYGYSLKAVDEQGSAKTLKFNAFDRDKPLKMNAYLLLEYNDKKGVLRWREVAKDEIPVKTLNKLDKK
jgi:uncharacterized protein (TIGR01655 family)